MKVLAELRDFCVDHANQVQGPEVQLVTAQHCIECDPQHEMFVGVETGAMLNMAVVVERPDLQPESYRDILLQALDRQLYVEPRDRAAFIEGASEEAFAFAEYVEEMEVGAVVVRVGGELRQVWSQARASERTAS